MSNFEVYEIDQHTWRIEDPIKVYMYLVEGENSALLIDTGMGFEGLDITVRSLTDKPVEVINTHGHLDHTGSDHLFENVNIMDLEKDVVKEHMGLEYRKVLIPGLLGSIDSDRIRSEIEKLVNIPEKKDMKYVGEGHIFDLGGRQLEVIWTPGHTPGSICLLDTENSQLFSGDSVCSMGVLLHLDHSMSLSIYRDSMEKLYGMRDRFDSIYPGHHEVPIDSEYIQEYMGCADKILSGEAATVEMPDEVLGDALLSTHRRIGIVHKGII